MKNLPLPSEAVLEEFVAELLLNETHADYGLLQDVCLSEYDPMNYVLRDFNVYQQAKIGAYGIMDIFVVSLFYSEKEEKNYSVAYILELKNKPLELADFEQLARYVTGVQRLNTFDVVVPILIGTNINTGHYIHNMIRNTTRVYLFGYTVDGISFELSEGDWIKRNCNETFESFMSRLDELPNKESI